MNSLPVHSQLVMACHITGIYDVNRSNTLPDDDYELVRTWANSIQALDLHGIIFHNNFSETTCARYQSDHLSFIRVTHNPQFNPNVFRYLVYRDFLREHGHRIDSLFVTDVSDVVVVRNPFVQPIFVTNPTTLFCGDEPKILANDWMHNHATHLRSKVADYADYEAEFANATLLNCGIIGGNLAVMQPFIEQLAAIHERYNHDNKTAYTGDMGAFNYLIRSRFNDQVFHGPPVNTEFKAYQNTRADCWFRHK
jgi:hypothetical protein